MNRWDVRWRTSGVAKLEFMAQEEIVTIVPIFQMADVNFLSGRYGPFEPPHPAEVPLWLAMLLKESRRCKIVTPEWMSKDQLTAVLKAEKEEDRFQPLPFHYIEMARLLCRWRGDVKDCTEVELLLKEIESIRDEKIRRGVAAIKPGNYGYSMASLTAMEVNTTRSVMTSLMNTMAAYDASVNAPARPLPGDLHALQAPPPAPEELDDRPAPAAPSAPAPTEPDAPSPGDPLAADPPPAAPAAPAPKRRRLRR
eukprot:TRINITY_DN22621_c0_g1_i1.p1 TRINITY_DN22621_c0_g1~~TRINITY_DN22621_c0_g1_i1.p1  ORF type:complete len:278 (+),score=88.17 TRINITY_DN22621_c0_g1_i1:76-834(+)